MKKIAMLNCLNSNKVCAGAACFTAFNKRIRSFERYQGMDVEVAAFMRCNGCGNDPETDAGILEKVERLQRKAWRPFMSASAPKTKREYAVRP